MSEAKKLKPGPKRKSSDSARKRNKKAENAKLNKNRIYIGDEYDGNKGRCSSGNERKEILSCMFYLKDYQLQ
jgi:hypothetical protein